jgi:hypothetical protein
VCSVAAAEQVPGKIGDSPPSGPSSASKGAYTSQHTCVNIYWTLYIRCIAHATAAGNEPPCALFAAPQQSGSLMRCKLSSKGHVHKQDAVPAQAQLQD